MGCQLRRAKTGHHKAGPLPASSVAHWPRLHLQHRQRRPSSEAALWRPAWPLQQWARAAAWLSDN